MHSLQTTRPTTYEPMAVHRRRHDTTSMPLCRYGQWCTRSNCIYEHNNARPPSSRPVVCLKYLQGQCVHGDACWYQHPDDPASIRAKLTTQPCQYGTHCPHGERCLFGHLRNDVWSGAYSKEFTGFPHNTKHAVIRRQDSKNPNQSSHQSTVPQSHPQALHSRARGRSV